MSPLKVEGVEEKNLACVIRVFQIAFLAFFEYRESLVFNKLIVYNTPAQSNSRRLQSTGLVSMTYIQISGLRPADFNQSVWRAGTNSGAHSIPVGRQRWNAGGLIEFLTAVAGHLSEMNQPSNAVSRVCLN